MKENKNTMSQRQGSAKKREYSEGATVGEVSRFERPGMPSRQRITLRAVANYSVAVATPIVSHAIGCNTPNQPFRTVSTTDTPGYLSWLQDAYEHCFTRASRIRIELINTTVGDSIFTVLSRDSDTTVSTNISDLAETRRAQSKVLGYFSAGTNMVRFTDEFRPYQALGVAWNSPDNKVGVGDPALPYYWIVSVKTSGGGTGNVAYRVIVDYDLEFADLKAPAP